jgi:hypothetical protein
MSEPLPFRLRLQIALREMPVPSRAKLAGFVVVSYMSDDGVAFPELETLERNMASSRHTVLNGLRDLEAAGFLKVVRGRSVNRYFPQLTPSLERLVEDFLDEARRRRGQLPLPLDGRGLSLVDDGVQSLHPQSAATATQSAVTAPEVVSEVVSEIGTGLPGKENEDLTDPLAALVADLADADPGTLHVFRSTFGDLSSWAIEQAHDDLLRRRKHERWGPLVSEAKYAFDALRRRRTGAA